MAGNAYSVYLIDASGDVYHFDNGFEKIASYNLCSRWTNLGVENKSTWLKIFLKEAPDYVHLFNPAGIGVAPCLIAKELEIPYLITIVDYWWQCPDSILINEEKNFCEGDKSYVECSRCILSRKNVPIYAKNTVLSMIAIAATSVKNGSINSLLAWNHRYTLIRDILNGSQKVVFLSKTAKKSYTKKYSLENGEYIQTPPKFSPKSARVAVAEETPSKLKVGFVGSIVEHKGLHVLMEALRQLPFKYCLNVAGRFNNEVYRERVYRAASLLEEVNYLGFLGGDALEQFYLTNDVVVVPSICPENQPQVVLECLSLGVPLLASNIPGVSELLKDDSFLFTMGDAIDLREKIISWEKKRNMFYVKLTSRDCFTENMVRLYLDLP